MIWSLTGHLLGNSFNDTYVMNSFYTVRKQSTKNIQITIGFSKCARKIEICGKSFPKIGDYISPLLFWHIGIFLFVLIKTFPKNFNYITFLISYSYLLHRYQLIQLQEPEYPFLGNWGMLNPNITAILLHHL